MLLSAGPSALPGAKQAGIHPAYGPGEASLGERHTGTGSETATLFARAPGRRYLGSTDEKVTGNREVVVSNETGGLVVFVFCPSGLALRSDSTCARL